MKTISTIAALALLGASAGVLAGEDTSTNWGAGGTGPTYWTTECGLENFPGPSADTPRACTNKGLHYQTSDSGKVPTPLPNAATGGTAPKDGHGGRKTPDSRK